MPLLESPEILRSILETMHTGVYFVGRDQRIQFWNEGAERITGYLRQDVVGHFCRDFFPPTNDEELTGYCDIGGALAEVLRDGKATCSDVSIRHRAGHQVLLRVWAVPIRGADGTIVGAAEGFEEDRWSLDSDRRQRKLEEYGCMDETQGVLSRGYLRTLVQQQLMTFAEHRLPFSVAGVRVSRVPDLRSQYGPAAIREILQVVAQTIITSLRPTESLGRLDDETFLGILPECNALDAERLGMRLQTIVNNMRVKWWGDNFPVAAGIAIATVERGDTAEALIRRAESRLAEKTRASGWPPSAA
jgi:PAS domain S-box-containing protein/diguanylate cyclase (GGDEF)-like protein